MQPLTSLILSRSRDRVRFGDARPISWFLRSLAFGLQGRCRTGHRRQQPSLRSELFTRAKRHAEPPLGEGVAQALLLLDCGSLDGVAPARLRLSRDTREPRQETARLRLGPRTGRCPLNWGRLR